jgi:molybdopterin-biosynthesis enzyme MoeA-like protein
MVLMASRPSPPSPDSTRKPAAASAAFLLIGNELLSGKVHEANLAPLAQLLFRHGVQLRRAVCVGDDAQEIARETEQLARTHTLVFTSGGVGPTHDDITMDSIAIAFKCAVIVHPLLGALIEGRYGTRCTEAHLRMARVPQGATLESSEGEVVDKVPPKEWPAVRMANVWILPGVPEAFRMKLPAIAQYLHRLGHRAGLHSLALFSQVEESAIVPALDALVSTLEAGITVGSYPKWFDATYKTKVTFDGPDLEKLQSAAESLVQSLSPLGKTWISTVTET